MRVTYTKDGPLFDRGVLRLDGLDELGQLVRHALGRVVAEPLANVLLLLFRVRRIPVFGLVVRTLAHKDTRVYSSFSPLNRHRLAVEKVGHEDPVFLIVVASREDVGTLNSLVKVAKDIKHDQDGLFGALRARDVCKGANVSLLRFILLLRKVSPYRSCSHQDLRRISPSSHTHPTR